MLINGVQTQKRKVLVDERGFLCEILRADNPCFVHFGQVYITSVDKGVVKAFHLHERQTDHFFCVHGKVKLVLKDDREGSPTKGTINEIILSLHNPQFVIIPPLVKHGFMGLFEPYSIILNIPDKIYNYDSPDETRFPAHEGYEWSIKDR